MILLALMAALSTQAQVTEIKFERDSYLLQYFDLTIPSGDTAFIFTFKNPPKDDWSIDFGWTGVTGEGVIKLEVTNFDELTPWSGYVDDLSTIISGATGNDAWEDSMWSWKYFRIVIEKGTLSAGYLSLKININN